MRTVPCMVSCSTGSRKAASTSRSVTVRLAARFDCPPQAGWVRPLDEEGEGSGCKIFCVHLMLVSRRMRLEVERGMNRKLRRDESATDHEKLQGST